MHPQVRLPDNVPCPMCGMELIPVEEESPEDAALGPRSLRVSEHAAALADIRTAVVVRRAVTRPVRMVGKVVFDDARLRYVTAWKASRIERMYVDYDGIAVQRGDPLVDLYSPELSDVQQEYLTAVGNHEALPPETTVEERAQSAKALDSARQDLLVWGFRPEQLTELVERGSPLERHTLVAPMAAEVLEKTARQGDSVDAGTRLYTLADRSFVWVELNAPESELSWLHYGQQVEIVADAYPDDFFVGRISFIDSILMNRMRTVKVRVSLPNFDLRLKPDMFVHATVRAQMDEEGLLVDPELAKRYMCPTHPSSVFPRRSPCPICRTEAVPTSELGFRMPSSDDLPLVIPDTAPLVTGARSIVYVRRPGAGAPIYEGREVLLGPRAGGHYIVTRGLLAGELVVVNGAFKLDSELEIRARPSMMNPPVDAWIPAGVIETSGKFKAGLGRMIEPLIEAAEALAEGDLARARTAGEELELAVASIPAGDLSEDALQLWVPLAATLADGSQRLSLRKGVLELRSALRDVSEAAITAMTRYGWSGPVAAPHVVHCPMAFRDTGANWLSSNGEIANPYFGDSMLRCGLVDRALPRKP